MSAIRQPCGMDVDSLNLLKSCSRNETALGLRWRRSLGWILSGLAAFDGLRLEKAALTSLLAKPGQVSLVTSCVRSVQWWKRFTKRSSLVSFNELTDIYMFLNALAFLHWFTQALPLSVIMLVLLLGLLLVMFYISRHISLVAFASSTLRCQIPRFTSVVSRDNSSFWLLFDAVWMPSLRRTSSRSINLSLISFVNQHCAAIRTDFCQMCLWADFSRIALMRACVTSTLILLLSHSWGIRSSTSFVKAENCLSSNDRPILFYPLAVPPAGWVWWW